MEFVLKLSLKTSPFLVLLLGIIRITSGFNKTNCSKLKGTDFFSVAFLSKDVTTFSQPIFSINSSKKCSFPVIKKLSPFPYMIAIFFPFLFSTFSCKIFSLLSHSFKISCAFSSLSKAFPKISTASLDSP